MPPSAPPSPVLRCVAVGLSAASLVLPLAMLVQLVLSLGADRSTHWWGLLSVHLSDTPAKTSIELGVDGVSTVLLWLVLVAACTAAPCLFHRSPRRP